MNYQAFSYELKEAGYLQVSGEDRQAFLQRQTTNDIRLLEPGKVLLTVLTSPTARIKSVDISITSDAPGARLFMLGNEAIARGAMEAGVLGGAGPTATYRNFTGAPVAGTWYPVALANALSGTDLNGSSAEIAAVFANHFNRYLGTDQNPAFDQYDFVSVVMHELGHGLGFLVSMWVGSPYCPTGQGCWGDGTGFPYIFDRFTENGSSQALINTSLFPNPSTALGTQLTSNNLFFDGGNTRAANGGVPAPIYAPSVWNGGFWRILEQ